MRNLDDSRRGIPAMVCAGPGACGNSVPAVPTAIAISPKEAAAGNDINGAAPGNFTGTVPLIGAHEMP